MFSFFEDHGIFLSPAIPAVLLAFYIALAVADLFSRGLLSRLVPWVMTMAMFPFALSLSVAVFIMGLTSAFAASGAGDFLECALACLASAALFISSAVIFIRGNIKPVDKKTVDTAYCSDDSLCYLSARRLIITGMVSAAVFLTVALIILIPEAGFWLGMMWEDNLKDTADNLVLLIFLLCIPFLNILAAMYLFFTGAVIAEIFFAFLLAYAELLLVTNACIRLILKTDKEKYVKVIHIVLSFIPIYNVIYGICALKKHKEAML